EAGPPSLARSGQGARQARSLAPTVPGGTAGKRRNGFSMRGDLATFDPQAVRSCRNQKPARRGAGGRNSSHLNSPVTRSEPVRQAVHVDGQEGAMPSAAQGIVERRPLAASGL